MARLIGPKHRLCRRLGMRLCTSDKCPSVRRPYPPGQHGPKRQPRLTEYGTQLLEKQKAKRIYGILERQFHGYYQRAHAQTGDTGKSLQQLLERRLDNVIYRLGWAKSRAAARQLVNHGHFLLDGQKVDIPSYQVSAGETITLHPHSAKSRYWEQVLKGMAGQNTPTWLAYSPEPVSGKVVAEPADDDLPKEFDVKMIVEYYSR